MLLDPLESPGTLYLEHRALRAIASVELALIGPREPGGTVPNMENFGGGG